MNNTTSEQFRPHPNSGGLSTLIRRLADLQVHTVMRSIIPWLQKRSGHIAEIGCGSQPYRHYLPNSCDYIGIDHAQAEENFDYKSSEVIYYEGNTFPLDSDHFDSLFHTEVLEHVIDTKLFLKECHRVLKPGGDLFFTVPFQARYHYIPYDYWRFTPSALEMLLCEMDFNHIQIKSRGSDIVVAGYKVVSLFYRYLLSKNPIGWLLALFLLPAAAAGLILAHLAILLNLGSKDDCLGFSVYASKHKE